MNDEAALEYEREIFRRTPEGRSLARIRANWPFPDPVATRRAQALPFDVHLRYMDLITNRHKANPFPPTSILVDDLFNALEKDPACFAAIAEGPPFEMPEINWASKSTSRRMRLEIMVVPRGGTVDVSMRRIPAGEPLP